MKTFILLSVVVLSSLLTLQLASASVGKVSRDFNDYIRKQLQADEDISTRAFIYTTIKNGTIKGHTARAVNNNTIYSYMRIPFAKPPVGELRFRNPQPAVGWAPEELDGTQLPNACPQFLTGVVKNQEDCLFINVYSSRTGNDTDRPLAPVMVFMYGGAFGLGDSSYYTGQRLVANDVILVVPNYRVNVLGFLATGDEASPGNYGLKDQNLALRWVQENIEAFGGDPNRVTIFGESAGAVSVIYHLLSPLSHGLFHQVIAQSGSAVEAWAQDRNPLKSAHRIATAVGCPIDSTEAIVNCLRDDTTWEDITFRFFEQLVEDLSNNKIQLLGTSPVVEPDLPGAFITEDPYKIMTSGYIPDVPVIMGATAEEGVLFLGGLHFLGFGNKQNRNNTIENPVWLREGMINTLLSTYELDPLTSSAIEETIALTYLPDINRLNYTEARAGLVDMISVFIMKGPVLKTADILSRRLSNVYLYSFEYRGRADTSLWYYVFDLFALILGGDTPPYRGGIGHADDLIYEFNLPFPLDEEEEKFSKLFVELWTNFAHFGTPTPEATADYPIWPNYHWKEPLYYVLNEKPTVARDYTLSWNNAKNVLP